jgi:hypothetical protein
MEECAHRTLSEQAFHLNPMPKLKAGHIALQRLDHQPHQLALHSLGLFQEPLDPNGESTRMAFHKALPVPLDGSLEKEGVRPALFRKLVE